MDYKIYFKMQMPLKKKNYFKAEYKYYLYNNKYRSIEQSLEITYTIMQIKIKDNSMRK